MLLTCLLIAGPLGSLVAMCLLIALGVLDASPGTQVLAIYGAEWLSASAVVGVVVVLVPILFMMAVLHAWRSHAASTVPPADAPAAKTKTK